jgi:hypothetical protein
MITESELVSNENAGWIAHRHQLLNQALDTVKRNSYY